MEQGRVKVAICDDHPIIREAMKFCLESIGYLVVLEAENGKMLIENLDSEQLPDICLVDMNMPEMNGLETTIYLKKNWPTVKVLIYSMNSDNMSRQKSFACGADGYLVKPCTIDEIETAIEEIIYP